jgi:predicted kinase
MVTKMMNFGRMERLLMFFGLASIPILVVTIVMRRERNKKKDLLKKQERTKKIIEGLSSERSSVDDDTLSPPSPNTWSTLGFEEPLVIAMVGLPARGKSYISKMLMRYLRWTSFECELFNVGSYRRDMGFASADAHFFEAGNKDAHKVREDLAMAVQEHMYKWLKGSGNKRKVAIFDATNTTISRRLALAKKARSAGVFLLFIESICDNPKVLAQNYALKLDNDDYKQMDQKKALDDFMERVKAYEQVYEVST